MQLFIHNIGKVEMEDEENETRRDLLLVILADKSVKVGLVIVQMRRFAAAIIDAIKASKTTMDMLHLSERQIKEYLMGLKTET